MTVAFLGKRILNRYAAKIPAEFMHMVYYKYVYIYSPSLIGHTYISHEDYKISISLGLAPE